MKWQHTKEQQKQMIKNLFLTVTGTIILAFGTAIFILPFALVTGGISSLAIIFCKLMPFLELDLWITIITWTLFFIGFLVLGKGFAMKTLISTIIYPIAISLFLKLTEPGVLGGFFRLQDSAYTDTALILAACVGGALVGVGCAVTFLGGGSTGGTDIIALTLCKFVRRLKSSVVIFLVDATTILIGVFVNGDLIICLLGILSAVIAAVMIDRVFLGGSRAFIAQIVSKKSDQISQEIITRLERTTTKIHAEGGYSKQDKELLMVSFTMAQYADLMQIIHTQDKEAFVTIHRAHEINGEGWTR